MFLKKGTQVKIITGKDKGPDLFQIINILKRKEILERLRESLKTIND